MAPPRLRRELAPLILISRVAFLYHFLPTLLHALLLVGVLSTSSSRDTTHLGCPHTHGRPPAALVDPASSGAFATTRARRRTVACCSACIAVMAASSVSLRRLRMAPR